MINMPTFNVLGLKNILLMFLTTFVDVNFDNFKYIS